MDTQYADSSEVFDRLAEYISQELEKTSFYKKLYKYMIRDNSISGKQVCLVLIEQQIVSVSEEQRAALENGSVSAYQFMRKLIENLQITPAQLALDPFSGSCVVVDPNTGEVLALSAIPAMIIISWQTVLMRSIMHRFRTICPCLCGTMRRRCARRRGLPIKWWLLPPR